MFDRKTAKKNAKSNLKKHYTIFVIACLIAAMLGSDYADTLSLINTKDYSVSEDVNYTSTGLSMSDVFDSLIEGNLGKSMVISSELQSGMKPTTIGIIEIGTARGVLSGLVSNISSGQFLITMVNMVNSVVKSKSVAMDIVIILCSLVMLLVSIFLKDMYKISFKRVFLEGYRYEKVKASAFSFLFKVKKVTKACLTIFITSVFQILWDFTIIGGIIKSYSYFLVPYIVAENPNIKSLDAITLSRRMMDGHKWECFKLDISFIGWYLLKVVTFGLSDVFFTNPYYESTVIEYYAYIRNLAIENKIENVELLNDKYLFEEADSILLVETYDDLVEIMTDEIELKDCIHTGIRGFFENKLGLIYKYDAEEDKYNIAIEQEETIEQYKLILIHKQYPNRLCPNYIKTNKTKLENTHYLRHYSIWSIIVLFFVFCFIGWSWEVMLHLVEDGIFVNRGTMHGPWLPIYGFGGILILMVLYPFRKNVALEAISAFTLCGVVEYFTHWYLELTKGIEWWDYSGYFLNINGRVCAEGLFIFMVGGLAVVYIIGPQLDNLVRKANMKILMPICITLLLIFAADMVYSHYYPNTGKGITDYQKVSYIDIHKQI
ncbi:MAG: DUF975 family protein [Erysipelotrichaceae bacterium]|nr:DUF975 family protein [Erysipelotrichaceae bacterium]